MSQNIKWYGGEVEKEVVKLNDAALKKAALIVERKSKQLVLRDTSTLFRSIFHDIDKRKHTAIVGTNVEYSPFVELGTKFWKGKSFLREALKQSRQKIARLYKGK